MVNDDHMICCSKSHDLLLSGMPAEKAIQSQIPTDYPFTVRVSCDVTDSNGNYVISYGSCDPVWIM